MIKFGEVIPCPGGQAQKKIPMMARLWLIDRGENCASLPVRAIAKPPNE